MLFNSFEFIFVFLPITTAVYYLLKITFRQKVSIVWLAAASLFFYSWWDFRYFFLILLSVGFNYSTGILLNRFAKSNYRQLSKLTILLGVTLNLLLLAYYKYAGFFTENVNLIFHTSFTIKKIILPLAISFFTFQQIAYLIDVYKRKAQDYDFFTYCLFVTFFPQLIAGPIVHHGEMMPQFLPTHALGKASRLGENLSAGLTLFILGLSKKVLLADTISVFSTPVFAAAGAGEAPGFYAAWGAVVAYALQIYFDFSGYSDMAIGLARMFGVVLPVNFNSPYKATSIAEFWRRWHMTLSRFLWQYLYIPLGGNRKGSLRQCVNIMITMFLGGLWHGAKWTFVVWGVLHGLFIGASHLYEKFSKKQTGRHKNNAPLKHFISVALTFFAVLVSWVLFRSDSLESSLLFYKGMFGFYGFETVSLSIRSIGQVLLTAGMLAVVFIFPNTQEWLRDFNPVLKTEDSLIHDQKKKTPVSAGGWEPSGRTAVFIGILAALNIILLFVGSNSEFLYFQF